MKTVDSNIGVVTSDVGAAYDDRMEYHHLDSCYREKCGELHSPRIYIYEDEVHRIDELNEAINNLRDEYIFAQGVVLPDGLEEMMPLWKDGYKLLESLYVAGYDGEQISEIIEDEYNG